jgi:hypothetical protein
MDEIEGERDGSFLKALALLAAMILTRSLPLAYRLEK